MPAKLGGFASHPAFYNGGRRAYVAVPRDWFREYYSASSSSSRASWSEWCSTCEPTCSCNDESDGDVGTDDEDDESHCCCCCGCCESDYEREEDEDEDEVESCVSTTPCCGRRGCCTGDLLREDRGRKMPAPCVNQTTNINTNKTSWTQNSRGRNHCEPDRRERDLWERNLQLEDVIYFLAKRQRHHNDERRRIEDWMRVMHDLENDDKPEKSHSKDKAKGNHKERRSSKGDSKDREDDRHRPQHKDGIYVFNLNNGPTQESRDRSPEPMARARHHDDTVYDKAYEHARQRRHHHHDRRR